MIWLQVKRNGEWFGHPHGGEMTFSFFRLIEHAAYSRTLRAGTILGSGTVSNAARTAGSACISANLEASHVLAAMGRLTHGNVRIHLYPEHTQSDITSLLQALKEEVALLRGNS